MVGCLAFLVHRWREPVPNGWLAAAALGSFLVVYPWHVATKLPAAEASYRVRDVVETVSASAWADGAWTKVHATRSALDGETGEPLAIQTDITLPDLAGKLEKAGWSKGTVGWAAGILAASLPSRGPIEGRAVLPVTDNGRLPVAIFTRDIGEGARLVLHAWPTDLAVGDGASARPVLALSLTAEELDPLAAGYATVEGAGLRSAERDGALEIIARALAARRVHDATSSRTVRLAIAR